MAIRIKARGSESVEQMLRRFKKLCEKEGLTKEVKKRQEATATMSCGWLDARSLS